MSTTSKLDRAVDIAKLALQFARVRRVTRHEDGRRPEFDSDHTVMLAILACDMAPEGLDLGLVAQFAIGKGPPVAVGQRPPPALLCVGKQGVDRGRRRTDRQCST